ncbi:uncharacterized protein LOC105702592 [Orussus abietinus]|uniref:uncharacterized protein LOC105702592 n=1 Tax=Orussus abietinus TaxID=222816 RepID=UPI00062629BB|nr:uncharacterized protein LOC105702592 [Orussus abietinus]
MIDGNISMEEDTELRDLVVQTLENNGVLAKVRAKLRASVFLALEEQESVMNPEPLLNKTVKQYLGNSEGKLLFSLVREFLEYFGLEYTISVYDPETYIGKDYNYAGRSKLCEELGINSTEPLLGELLKHSINSAFNNSRKNETGDSKLNKTVETSTHFSNSTFEVTVPKMLHKDSTSFSNDNDSSERMESISESSPKIPINVTITDKKKGEWTGDDTLNDNSNYKEQKNILRETNKNFENSSIADGIDSKGNNNVHFSKTSTNSKDKSTVSNYVLQETDVNALNETNLLNKTDPLIKFDESIDNQIQINQNEDASKQNIVNSMELQNVNMNVQNIKQISVENNMGKRVFFDEIIIDGKKEKVDAICKTESLLGELPSLAPKTNSIFSDLPPLNTKKTNINDLKELMDLANDGVDNYEEDFISSASGSANEQSPSKVPEKLDSPVSIKSHKKDDRVHSMQSEDVSEDIEEICSSTSCPSV